MPKAPIIVTLLHLLIKNLLKAGLPKTAIKKFLKISRYRMDKIFRELVLLNSTSPYRKSRLIQYVSLIEEWMKQGENYRSIQKSLSHFKVNVHYTTVRNFVRNIERKMDMSTGGELPGEAGYVYVMKIPQFRDAYLFCFLLGYSHFSFFTYMKCRDMQSFLDCHDKCFCHLKGIPKKIQICEASAFRLTKKERLKYKKFIASLGARLQQKTSTSSEKSPCISHANRAKKEILDTFFHSNRKRLIASLKNRHLNAFNLSVHPITQKPIYQEFEKTERPKLLMYTRKEYPQNSVVHRKVSKRGRVCYQYNFYKIPNEYCGKRISISTDGRQLLFSFSNKTIAICPISKAKGKIYNLTRREHKNQVYDYHSTKRKH